MTLVNGSNRLSTLARPFVCAGLAGLGCTVAAGDGAVVETVGHTAQAVTAEAKAACSFAYTPVTALTGAPTSFGGATGFAGSPMVFADVTGDGKSDIVAQTALDGVATYVGNGDGTFTKAPDTKLPPPASGKIYVGLGIVATGDFDGDGKADVAMVSTTAFASAPGGEWFGRFIFLYGKADGTLESMVQTADLMTSGNGTAFHIARDFDGDGRDDFMFGNLSYQSVMFANAGRTFSAASSAGSGNPGDVAALRGAPNASLFFLSTPRATQLTWNAGRTKSAQTLQSPPISAHVAGDLDGDGKLEVADKVSGWGTPAIQVGTVDATSSTSVLYGFNGYTQVLMAADVVGDRKQELVYVDSDEVYAACGYTPGTTDLVAAPLGIPLPYGVTLVNAGDLNGDGKADFLATKSGGVYVAAYLSGPKPAVLGPQVMLSSTPPVPPGPGTNGDAGAPKPGTDSGAPAAPGTPDPGADPAPPSPAATQTTSGCAQTPRKVPSRAAALFFVGLGLAAVRRRRR
jgi:hypothetical protein